MELEDPVWSNFHWVYHIQQ